MRHLMRHLMLVLLVVLGAFLMLEGCASQPSRFYLLGALPEAGTMPLGTSGAQAPTIGVGPVSLPRYLDRPQIVTRTGPNELKLAEFDRWAEGLDANFARVVAENLSLMLPTARVVFFPWLRATTIDYQVTVDVAHFVSQVGGEGLLIADWLIFQGEGPQVVATGRSRFSAPAAGQDYASMVAALSQTVASLSREIATSLRGMGPRASAR
jgi:uncharacterized protein